MEAMVVRRKSERSGQAMLIAVLAMGGAMMGATAIAGLLILYQIRATTNSVNSAKSIFAADSGVDWALYSYYCQDDGRCPNGPPPLTVMLPGSGAIVSSTCYDVNNNVVACNATTSVNYVVSEGTSLGTSRAFFLSLSAGTTTFP